VWADSATHAYIPILKESFMMKVLGVVVVVAGALALATPVRAQKVTFAEVLKDIQKCNIDVVKALMGGGQIAGTPILDPNGLQSPDGVPLVVAASATDCVEGVHAVLNAGASTTDRDPQGNTPLHLAAASSTLQMVQLLVDKSADVNAKNAKGETPLALAKTNNYKGKTDQRDKIVAFLTKKGAK
jgi:hypothetical protein